MIIPKGTLFSVWINEYNDRSCIGTLRAVVDIDTDVCNAKYRAMLGDSSRTDLYQFPYWLVEEMHLAERLPVGTWHIGSYGVFEPREPYLVTDD